MSKTKQYAPLQQTDRWLLNNTRSKKKNTRYYNKQTVGCSITLCPKQSNTRHYNKQTVVCSITLSPKKKQYTLLQQTASWLLNNTTSKKSNASHYNKQTVVCSITLSPKKAIHAITTNSQLAAQ